MRRYATVIAAVLLLLSGAGDLAAAYDDEPLRGATVAPKPFRRPAVEPAGVASSNPSLAGAQTASEEPLPVPVSKQEEAASALVTGFTGATAKSLPQVAFIDPEPQKDGARQFDQAVPWIPDETAPSNRKVKPVTSPLPSNKGGSVPPKVKAVEVDYYSSRPQMPQEPPTVAAVESRRSRSAAKPVPTPPVSAGTHQTPAPVTPAVSSSQQPPKQYIPATATPVAVSSQPQTPKEDTPAPATATPAAVSSQPQTPKEDTPAPATETPAAVSSQPQTPKEDTPAPATATPAAVSSQPQTPKEDTPGPVTATPAAVSSQQPSDQYAPATATPAAVSTSPSKPATPAAQVSTSPSKPYPPVTSSPSSKAKPSAEEAKDGLNEKSINDIVKEHNVFRYREKVPPIEWNATLATYAQKYAEKRRGDCKLEHSTGPYGENMMFGTGKEWTWKKTVDDWSNEKKSYDYNSNSCQAGKQCAHYTAVVWRNTTGVGCGRVVCSSGDTIMVCSYWPPGNYENVKPF
ncbi:protein PRY1-like [Oryza brachyantha]|uniref:protein PRY1-like n=1 Tax=Oryza brachyantha TaxID=4533 RepID=UPI001ADCFCA0|nr:protein PRY1-like [Oryza brachyantha]